MSAPFKVGEVAIGQKFIFWPELNGMECEIIHGLAPRYGVCIRSGSERDTPTYIVRWANGFVSQAEPNRLRRRKPPAADSNERTFMQRWRDMADKAPQRVGETA